MSLFFRLLGEEVKGAALAEAVSEEERSALQAALGELERQIALRLEALRVNGRL